MGMVIPAWFAPDVPEDQVESLLIAALADFETLVHPDDLVVVIDGVERVLRVVERLRRLGPFRVLWSEENRGKGAAVVEGTRVLLSEDRIEFVMMRDADGDHFLNDAPHLFRLGLQMREESGNPCLAVIGRRTSVHRPLGWMRGEYELLLNELLIEAFKLFYARSGKVLNTQYFSTYSHFPDMQSGYKLYSREAASLAAEGLRRAQKSDPSLDMMRWGSELVPMVEIVRAGGLLGEITRMTFYDQPVTSYGRLNRPQTYGAKIAWALRRMEIDASQAAQLMANTFPRRDLFTDPTGREELLSLWDFVLKELGGEPDRSQIRMPGFC